MSYTLQDLKCVKCNQVKRENMCSHCSCAGEFENLVQKKDVNKLLMTTFKNIANLYEMPVLDEFLTFVNKNFK